MRPVSLLAMTLVFLSLESRAQDGEDYPEDDLEEEEIQANLTGPGTYVGAPCEDSCSPSLVHVVCDPEISRCKCEHKHPVKLGPFKGCAKPARLGDQCFYYKTCSYSDQNSECVQIRHNAICQCKQGYHEVTLFKPHKRVFCSQDVMVVTTDTSTLLGVATGLAIFTALICFVLRLFVGAQPRHYANANLAPPILFASDTGIPLTVHSVRPGSRASSERSVGSTGYSQRGSRGVIVPASRAGAARAAAILLISCHLTPEQTQQGSRVLSLASVHSSSSARSFSARRYEREKEQRLARERAREVSPNPRSTEQLLSEQSHELDEWPNKGSDNTIDAVETSMNDELSNFPPLSTSLPEYPHHSPEWPKPS